MDKEFAFKVITPSRPLLDAKVSEVVLPAFDGEVGILPGHEDFIGLVGTGVLKVVRGGDDYWYMISAGVFRVKSGVVTVLVEVGEDAREINVDASREQVKTLESSLAQSASATTDDKKLRLEFDRARARVEAHRRTALLN